MLKIIWLHWIHGRSVGTCLCKEYKGVYYTSTHEHIFYYIKTPYYTYDSTLFGFFVRHTTDTISVMAAVLFGKVI